MRRKQALAPIHGVLDIGTCDRCAIKCACSTSVHDYKTSTASSTKCSGCLGKLKATRTGICWWQTRDNTLDSASHLGVNVLQRAFVQRQKTCSNSSHPTSHKKCVQFRTRDNSKVPMLRNLASLPHLHDDAS
jgi:hypothetical protein